MLDIYDVQHLIAQVTRLRMLACATSDPISLELEREYQQTQLHRNGFTKEHIRGISALAYPAILQLCGLMNDPESTLKIKLLLCAIARANLRGESVYEIKSLIRALPKHLPHPDQLARLLRICLLDDGTGMRFLKPLISRSIYCSRR